jgi:hypothetical protein
VPAKGMLTQYIVMSGLCSSVILGYCHGLACTDDIAHATHVQRSGAKHFYSTAT